MIQSFRLRDKMAVMDHEDHDIASKNRAALIAAVDLMEFGIRLMRQNISRALPGATPNHVDAELRRWLFDQPEFFRPEMPASDRAK